MRFHSVLPNYIKQTFTFTSWSHSSAMPVFWFPTHYNSRNRNKPLLCFVPLIRKETKSINKILFPKKTKLPNLFTVEHDRLTMCEKILNHLSMVERGENRRNLGRLKMSELELIWDLVYCFPLTSKQLAFTIKYVNAQICFRNNFFSSFPHSEFSKKGFKKSLSVIKTNLKK